MDHRMKRKLLILLLAVIFCWFAITVFLVNRVSGGHSMKERVATVVKTNAFFMNYFNQQIIDVKANDGPWTVHEKSDGTRDGFYSFLIGGVQSNSNFKVEWSEASGRVKLTRILLELPYKQDKLLWEE